MAITKPEAAAKIDLVIPGGVTHSMLARALFLESIQDQKLTVAARQQRWKEEGRPYMKRASRVVKHLTKMSAKGAS